MLLIISSLFWGFVENDINENRRPLVTERLIKYKTSGFGVFGLFGKGICSHQNRSQAC